MKQSVRTVLASAVWLILFLFSLSASTPVEDGVFLQKVGSIILDPGHGGSDPGAVGTLRTSEGSLTIFEKDVNLSVALQISEILSASRPEMNIILTRKDDSSVSLQERAHTANAALAGEVGSGGGGGGGGGSKIFVSIHANSIGGAGADAVYGYELWKRFRSQRYDFLSAVVPETAVEKRVILTNDDLNVELDRAEELLSESLLMALDASLSHETKSRGIKEAGFYVLMHSYMPSVLVEMGFMSNESELIKLTDPGYQKLLAESIARGLLFYCSLFEDSQ
ncbi:MAG: N-acetylmuramoyl-L-alanine amidase [Spirochaetia bacterium]|nr:N-acetylmuramoyl-L-alanine amidase [Spirochaetia bacterium]